MGNSKQNVKNNTMVKQGLILILANIIVRFFGFVYRIPLTNMLGDEGNGIYAASFNVYYLFLILSSASIPAVISKLVSERVAKNKYGDAHQVYKVAYLITFALGFICMFILWFNAKNIEALIKMPGSYLSIKVLAPTVFLVSIMSVYRGYFQGLKNTVPTAISQVIEQIFNCIVSLIGAYFLVKISVAHGSAGSTLGTLVGALTGLITIIFIYKKHKKTIIKKVRKSKVTESNKKIAIEIGKTAFPIILGTTVFAVTNLIDTTMIMERLTSNGVFVEGEAKALYGQLTGKFLVLTNLPISIATVFSASVIPNIAEMYVKGEKKLINKSINIAIKTVMIIAIPAFVGMTVLAKEIYSFLYPSYPDGYILMYIGGISIVIVAFNQIIVSIIQGLNRLYLPLIATIISVVIKIILNYILIAIPSINIKGAVFSTVISYFIFLLIDLYFLKNITKTKIMYKIVLFKPLFASIVMGVFAYLINSVLFVITSNNTLALLTSVMCSGLIYFLILILIGSIGEKEISKVPKGYLIIKVLKKIKVL